jgi:peroxiredoxin
MKNKMARIALLVVLIAAAVIGFRWTSEQTAPDVEFTTLKGERIRLRDLRGHPVLVTFWASDCRGCIEEMPDLSSLHRDYAGRGFQLVAVAMRYDPPNRVVALAEAKPLSYPVALDPLGHIAEAFGRVQLVPNSFLIAPDGRIALHHLGRIRAEDLRAPIERMLGET